MATLTLTSNTQEKGPFNNRPDPSAFLAAPKPKARENPPVAPPGAEASPKAMQHGMPFVIVDPEASNRVFVDVTSFNTKVYYVTGDVGRPGRLPFTGRETVLDALNFAANPLPTADEGNIHLRRPARGSKPTRDYKIDLEAIRNGDPRANLQIFPGDRLVVGRDPIVTKAVEVDRMAAPLNSIYNMMLQYSFSLRSMAVANAPVNNAIAVKAGGRTYTFATGEPIAMGLAQREAMMKEWLDLWWSAASKGGAKIDEKAFRDTLIKGLYPPMEPEKK